MPDSVLEAVSGYLLAANANAGGKFLTSMVTDDVIASARAAASDLLGVPTDEVTFGANMTSLNFAPLAHGRARLAGGRRGRRDEARPRREHLAVARARPRQAAHRPLLRARRRVPDRPRPPALAPLRPDEGRRVPDGLERGRDGHAVEEIVELAHEAGALAWVDAVHYAPHGEIEIAEIGCDVLLCSPYKFYGPHLGLAWVRRELLGELAAVQGAAAERRARAAARDGDAAARAALRASSRASSTCTASAGSSSTSTSASSGSGSSTGSRTAGSCTGRRRWRGASRRSACRRPTSRRPRPRVRLGAAGFAVWDGNYYAVEVFKHLGLPDGAIRVGIVHTNMEDEVDRLLAAMPRP